MSLSRIFYDYSFKLGMFLQFVPWLFYMSCSFYEDVFIREFSDFFFSQVSFVDVKQAYAILLSDKGQL